MIDWVKYLSQPQQIVLLVLALVLLIAGIVLATK